MSTMQYQLMSFIFIVLVCLSETKNQTKGKSTNNATKMKNMNYSKSPILKAEKSTVRGTVNKKEFLSGVTLVKSIVENSTEILGTTSESFGYNYTTIAEEYLNETTEGKSTDTYETTEINVFSKTNKPASTEPPETKIAPKIQTNESCFCNLMYHSCDINCCCDDECSDEDRKTFSYCQNVQMSADPQYCYSSTYYFKNNTVKKVFHESENLLCILKENLPERRNTISYHKITDEKVSEQLTKNLYKWTKEKRVTKENVFKPKPYAYGDPVWSWNNTDHFVLDIPVANFKTYCNDRKSIGYLKSVQSKCLVKVADLEMFSIYKTINNTILAGMQENVQNNAEFYNFQNCSKFICVNWTTFVCSYDACEPFNGTRHSPHCSDVMCTNMATKVKYMFYCVGKNITKAEIFMYIMNISAYTNIIEQEVSVKFYLVKSNDTSDMIELSGNPGYIIGKPVIRRCTTNGSIYPSTYNYTYPLRNLIAYPYNIGGNCVFYNITHESIKFGLNVRSKCRYRYVLKNIDNNATRACHAIQNTLYEYLHLNHCEKVFISPMGNPNVVSKDDWLDMFTVRDDKPIRGEHAQNSVLVCYNFVTLISYEFLYANVSRSGADSPRDLKIMRSSVYLRSSDRTDFDLHEKSIVLSTNVQFFGISNPAVSEYARGPQLHVHLPSDFFYPFTYNKAHIHKTGALVFCVFVCIAISI